MKIKSLLFLLPALLAISACTPTDPENPVEPDTPVTPEPGDPEEPDTPVTPDPDDPEEPDTPVTPDPGDPEDPEPEEPADPGQLADYTIAYAKADAVNTSVAAIELQAGLKDRHNITLDIASVDGITSTTKYLYLDLDSGASAKTYSISKSNDNFVLTSDTVQGLISASSHLLDTSVTLGLSSLSNWYKTPISNQSYETFEPIKIMSYNVRCASDTLANGETGTIAKRSPRIIKGIKTFMPDSVGVQECTDDLRTNIFNGLNDIYGYVGWGRETNYKGERSGIFYNRNKLTLLKSETKWLSDTPDVAGSHFSNYGGYNRIITSAIFRRHSDNFIYMHVNTHFDLTSAARLLDAQFVKNYIDQYSSYMPVYLTGDFNAKESTDGDAIQYFLENGYTDLRKEAPTTDTHWTYPVEGYYKVGVPDNEKIIIDFIFKADKGGYAEVFNVDETKYSGDGVEAPAVTSDHYPIYAEVQPYSPLVEFEPWNYGEDNVAINNQFALYDRDFNYLNVTQSTFKNRVRKLASNATHNGQLKDPSVTYTQYSCVGNLDKSGRYIEYSFNSAAAGKADLVLVVSSSMWKQSAQHNFTTPNLDNIVDLSVNNSNVDVNHISLRNTDIDQWYEWELLVLKNFDIVAGANKVKMSTVLFESTYHNPNHLLLDVFSDQTIS